MLSSSTHSIAALGASDASHDDNAAHWGLVCPTVVLTTRAIPCAILWAATPNSVHHSLQRGPSPIVPESLLQSLPAIYGQAGAVSAVPTNTAQYILDLENTYLHYFGDQQVFLLSLSPKLKEHLQRGANDGNGNGMPVVYGLDHLKGKPSICDWSRTPGWSSPKKGADARTVFYGREIRQAPRTRYGNAIHLSLGAADDPEGWTPAEMKENYDFWRAIEKKGESVGAADELRRFRNDVGRALGGGFKRRWGGGVTTKAHRFALQMYDAKTQNAANNPGGRLFEFFPNGEPPTKQV